jgi:hypothetical protein
MKENQIVCLSLDGLNRPDEELGSIEKSFYLIFFFIIFSTKKKQWFASSLLEPRTVLSIFYKCKLVT